MSFHPSKCQVLHITRANCLIQTKYILHGTVLESVPPPPKYLGVTISDNLSWTPHINSVSKKANQTLGFLKRNIKVHNKDLKSTAYTTLVLPQLEYASTVLSPHTVTDITKLEAVQRRSAHWAPRDYQHSSSVTQMIKDLNWCTLEQRHIDRRLTFMYKITYDLVAIPAADYLILNTRQSRHNHQLAYRQIPTLKDYYKFTFLSCTIVRWNALPFYIPVLPTVAQFSHVVCQVVHVSSYISEVLLHFNYTNPSTSLVYFFLTIQCFSFHSVNIEVNLKKSIINHRLTGTHRCLLPPSCSYAMESVLLYSPLSFN